MTYPLYLVHYHTGGLVFAHALRRGVGLWPELLLAYVMACLTA